jgi:DNA-binding GntR family transcriptional regulator
MSSPIVFAPSLREQIADRLRADLLTGQISEGAALTEQSLSERFAVSRTPVREAIQQLTYEGLLEGRKHAGVRVTRQPSAAISEFAMSVRRSVETFALRTCFHDLNAADFLRWADVLERMRAGCAAREYRTIAENDIAFHRLLVRRAHDRELEAVWVPLLSRVRRHFVQTQKTNYADAMAIHAEHAALLQVFRAGDLDAAVEALEKHVC